MPMPRVYLSPSLQEFNLFVNGGTEEEYANYIIDAMEPYLRASDIEFDRNSPEMSLSQAIDQSNAGDYDFHLSIHSNAGPVSMSGQLQGPDVYYYADSFYGREMADIIVENFKRIYPDEGKVNAVPTVTFAELRRTRIPANLVEVAYHDNVEDANWIKNNINLIARELSRSLAEYFDVPFVEPIEL